MNFMKKRAIKKDRKKTERKEREVWKKHIPILEDLNYRLGLLVEYQQMMIEKFDQQSNNRLTIWQ